MGEDPELEGAIDDFVARLDSSGVGQLRAGLPWDDGTSTGGLPIGTRIGRYKIAECLGSGGQGLVYRATRDDSDDVYALKILRFPFLGRARSRLRREAEILRGCSHRNICPLVEADISDRLPFLVMPLLFGSTLAQEIERSASVYSSRNFAFRAPNDESTSRDLIDDPRRLMAAFADLCEGLDVVHQESIVHRDVKPGNIMVHPDRQNGRLVLFDFGYAADEDDESLTMSRELPGTPAYMAPEQIERARGRVDARTDVYSMGTVVYEALAGRRAFSGTDRKSISDDILAGNVTRLRFACPGIPRELEAIVEKAMSVDIAERFATAKEFGRELRLWAEGLRTTTRPRTRWEELVRWVRLHPKRSAMIWVATIILAAMLLVGGVFAFEIATERGRRQKAEDLSRLMTATTEVEGLLEEERFLHPAEPEQLPRLDEWLERAAKLRKRLADLAHRSAADDESISTLKAPSDAEIKNRLWRDDARREDEIERLEMESAAIRRKLADRDDPDEADRADDIADRIAELKAERRRSQTGSDRGRSTHERLAAAIDAVERRRAEVQESMNRVSADDRERWDAVRSVIRSDPRFAGRDIEPIPGLIPLGADPTTGLAEFLHAASHAPGEPIPVRGTDGFRMTPGCGIVFVLCPGGDCRIGAQASDPAGPNYDPDAKRGEGPPQLVRLAPFLIGKYELTQAQWRRMSGTTPSFFNGTITVPGASGDYAIHPVESISWADLRNVLWKFSLDLPTEAQWESAARGGKDMPWWCGRMKSDLSGRINIADRSVRRIGENWNTIDDTIDDGKPIHCAVDELSANGFGIYGILGNVWEWCRDRSSEYSVIKARDGDGARIGSAESTYAFRGGAYDRAADDARVAFRGTMPVQHSTTDLGARVVSSRLPTVPRR